jgi:uncharacterized RDD family membrane protein YckC
MYPMTDQQGVAPPASDPPPAPDPKNEIRGRRTKAAWADIGVLFIALLVFVAVAGTVDTGPDEYGFYLEGLPFVFYLLFVLGYFFLLEAFNGQTLGKRWQDLEVVAADGERAGFGPVAGRTLFRVVDWLPAFYLVGYIAVRTSSEGVRLGDRASRTRVVNASLGETERGMSVRAAALALAALAAGTLAAAAATTDRGEADATCADGAAFSRCA